MRRIGPEDVRVGETWEDKEGTVRTLTVYEGKLVWVGPYDVLEAE